MQTIVKGTFLPQAQNISWEFDPQTGYLILSDYKGSNQQLMLNLQQDFVRAGIACKLTYHQGDTATLEVHDSTQQYTIDVWQIVGNEERRDLFIHPNARALLTDPDMIASIRQHLENNDKSSDAFPDDPSDILFPVRGTLIESYYEMYQGGQTEYQHAQYVLRHTTNVANRWPRNIADIGVDNIYTTAELLSETQNSGLWVFPLPYPMAFEIANILPAPAVDGYLWGWLKTAPTKTTAANNRMDITTEYILEQWPTSVYAPF